MLERGEITSPLSVLCENVTFHQAAIYRLLLPQREKGLSAFSGGTAERRDGSSTNTLEDSVLKIHRTVTKEKQGVGDDKILFYCSRAGIENSSPNR